MLLPVTPLAFLDLAWHALVVHPLKRLRVRGSGLERFRAAYAGDAFRPTTAVEREAHRLAARCVGCGLCEDGAAPLARPALAALGRPAAFRLAGRRAADAGLEGPLLEACAAAGSPVHRCPTGIPLDRVIDVLRARPVAPAGAPG